MKKYSIEIAKTMNDCFDDAYGDYVEAETVEEAVDIYKNWMIEQISQNVEDEEERMAEAEAVDEYFYKVTDVESGESEVFHE